MSSARGTTLLEVLMASAILIIGLTGLTQLVIHGMNAFRNAAVQTGAELGSQSAVADVMMTPFLSLTDGTFDGGVTVDVDGRRYTRTIIVTPWGDGGIAARRVEVRTAWTDSVGLPRVAVAVGMINETPDAN